MSSQKSRVIVLGEITHWGHQFAQNLQNGHVFDFVFETSTDKFLESTQVGHPQIVMIENLAGCRSLVGKIRAAGRRVYMIWIGRSFSKEDLNFALENRIYAVFEDARSDDPKVHNGLKGALDNVNNSVQFDQILRSLKSLLVQHESDADKPFMNEVKTAVVKLERSSLHNEFAGIAVGEAHRQSSSVPFHESQVFGDALLTVNELERTGILKVRGGSQQDGSVEFLQGKLISAVTGGVRGIKALYRMFLWDDAHFVFTRRDVKSESIQTDLNGELKEICEFGDSLKARFEEVRKEIPPQSLVLAMEPKWMQISTSMTPNLFSTLGTVIEFGQVGLVLDYCPLPDVDVMENLIALKRLRAIKVVSTRAPLAL